MRTTLVVITALVLLASGAASAMTASEMAAAVPEELKMNPPAGTYWDEELGVFVFDPPIPIELPPSMLLEFEEDTLKFDGGLMVMASYNLSGYDCALTKFRMRTPACEEGAWMLSSVMLACYNVDLYGRMPDPVNVIVREHNSDCGVWPNDGLGPEVGRQGAQPIPLKWDGTQNPVWQRIVFQQPVPIRGDEFWVIWQHTPVDIDDPLSLYVLGNYGENLPGDEYRFFEQYQPCPTILYGYGPWMIRAVGHCPEAVVGEGKIDIKPTSCPNPINPEDLGVVSVAILGTDEFDASQVDPASVLLNGVVPLRSDLEDVSTPYEGELCGCHTLGPDGFVDLVFKFDVLEVYESLGRVEDNTDVPIILTWMLFDGTVMQGSDCFLTRLNKHALPLDEGGGSDSYVGEANAQGEDGGLQVAIRRSGAVGFSLQQNTPNPVRSRTTIMYSLSENAYTTLTVHDASGATVATLAQGERAAGIHTAEWMADVPAGVYFYTLVSGELNATRKLICLR